MQTETFMTIIYSCHKLKCFVHIYLYTRQVDQIEVFIIYQCLFGTFLA